MRANTPAIMVEHLTKRFNDITAIDRLNFEITALLSGNGAGKTTTLSLLLGLMLPTEGRIEVLDTDMLKNRYAVLPRMNFSSRPH